MHDSLQGRNDISHHSIDRLTKLIICSCLLLQKGRWRHITSCSHTRTSVQPLHVQRHCGELWIANWRWFIVSWVAYWCVACHYNDTGSLGWLIISACQASLVGGKFLQEEALRGCCCRTIQLFKQYSSCSRVNTLEPSWQCPSSSFWLGPSQTPPRPISFFFFKSSTYKKKMLVFVALASNPVDNNPVFIWRNLSERVYQRCMHTTNVYYIDLYFHSAYTRRNVTRVKNAYVWCTRCLYISLPTHV